MENYLTLVFLLATAGASFASAVIIHSAIFTVGGALGAFIILGLSAFWMVYTLIFLRWEG